MGKQYKINFLRHAVEFSLKSAWNLQNNWVFSRNSKKTDDHFTHVFGDIRDGFNIYNAEISTEWNQNDLHSPASVKWDAFKTLTQELKY